MSAQSDPSSQHFHNVRLKWILDALESGRREVGADVSDDAVLSVGGEHIGWRGEWKLDNPRYISQEYFRSMSSGQIAQNDVLLVKDGATIGKAALASTLPAENSAVNEHVFLLRFSKSDDPRYYFYFIQSQIAQDQIHLHVRGSAQPGLNAEFVNVVVAPRPQKCIQKAIADYLDRETARLDALVAAKERLLALLAEKRRAIVTRAVTRGLDPRVPTRDSGVPWLGEIPAHWELTRLKFLADVRGGLALGKGYRDPCQEEYPYISVANVQDGYLSLDDVKKIPVPRKEAENYLLRTGDVLMNEGGDDDKIGRGCVWNGAIAPCLHQNHVFAVRPWYVEPEWIDMWTSSDTARYHFQNYAKRTTNLASISAANIRELPLLVPPTEERREIVGYCTASLQRLAAAQSTIVSTTVLIKERRAALVAAAVAGRINVGAAS